MASIYCSIRILPNTFFCSDYITNCLLYRRSLAHESGHPDGVEKDHCIVQDDSGRHETTVASILDIFEMTALSILGVFEMKAVLSLASSFR
jgi:hypothetical protein